jgi:hypothetical protein
MAVENQSYHYDYTRLDTFFQNHLDPIEVANHLDTIRDRLVALVDHEEGYRETIRNDYTILGELRDILLHLQKQS